jgi:hypothetical protein
LCEQLSRNGAGWQASQQIASRERSSR